MHAIIWNIEVFNNCVLCIPPWHNIASIVFEFSSLIFYGIRLIDEQSACELWKGLALEIDLIRDEPNWADEK